MPRTQLSKPKVNILPKDKNKRNVQMKQDIFIWSGF